ncbi:metalloregulator ArsR/SmtB family transcription factor [Phytohabitans sp. LJ34]|uniref:metalloregulator ArsR/SmtB family transcription factor n=1 Tax=Phytohabitans sp. LJ34 TaxID=3452217 RepID=UPI003F89134E
MDEVAGAIADPVRREILAMIRERRMSAGQIADRFAISRPAVSRHLRVLRESGLVHDELTGRQRFYRLDPAPLDALARWLTPFLRDDRAAAWEGHFDALETEVYRTRRERRGATATATETTERTRERRGAAAKTAERTEVHHTRRERRGAAAETTERTRERRGAAAAETTAREERSA